MKAEGWSTRSARRAGGDHLPKPLVELLDAAYETYRRGHPWVADFELSPKSVARTSYERAMTFVEYIGHYGCRSEACCCATSPTPTRRLRKTVPEEARTVELPT